MKQRKLVGGGNVEDTSKQTPLEFCLLSVGERSTVREMFASYNFAWGRYREEK